MPMASAQSGNGPRRSTDFARSWRCTPCRYARFAPRMQAFDAALYG